MNTGFKKTGFIIAAIALQIMVLAYMAANREYIVRTGEIVYLRTAPIDPRDIFRGDYVRLKYGISDISSHDFQEGIEKKVLKKGQKVYTVLNREDNKLAEFSFAAIEKPQNALFIKGRITQDYWTSAIVRAVRVKYGIEAYFVEQGKGLDMEKRRGNRNAIQIPLEMEIALGKDGTAVIKSYRWCALGMGLEVLRKPERNNQDAPRSSKIRLTLMNASDSPLALVNLPDFRSFNLKPIASANKEWVLSEKLSEPVFPSDSDVIVLDPEEKYSFDFDFSDPRWYVKTDGKPVEIGTLEWTEMFRLVYMPPDKEKCRNLEQKEIIWHGKLHSRSFHGRGQVD